MHSICLGRRLFAKPATQVSLRNAANSGDNVVQDPLNQLIISEVYDSEQTEMLFDMVRTQPHDLGRVAFELLMDSPIEDQELILGSLEAAISSPNAVIRKRLIKTIVTCIDNVLKTNQNRLKDNQTEFFDDEPYWDLLETCLKHGVKDIAESAANTLIARSKRIETVLEFVYDSWLDAYDDKQQRKACTALKNLRPSSATERLLDRVFEKDQTETADVQSLLNLVVELNQYSETRASRLLEYTNVAVFGERERLAHKALLMYSGVSNKSTSADSCRPELLCDILDGLKRNSHFFNAKSIFKALKDHKANKWISARLDGLLRDVSTTLTRDNLLPVRLAALETVVARYDAMTLSKDLPKEEHQNTPVLEATWDGADWDALKEALDENLQYHPIESRRKEYLSDFQQVSAFALIMNQGYDLTHLKLFV